MAHLYFQLNLPHPGQSMATLHRGALGHAGFCYFWQISLFVTGKLCFLVLRQQYTMLCRLSCPCQSKSASRWYDMPLSTFICVVMQLFTLCIQLLFTMKKWDLGFKSRDRLSRSSIMGNEIAIKLLWPLSWHRHGPHTLLHHYNCLGCGFTRDCDLSMRQ